jgi:hypothetical protein
LKEDVIAQFTRNITIKTDIYRANAVIKFECLLHVEQNQMTALCSVKAQNDRINPEDFKDFEWLFPETTMNFDKLSLAYRGFCAYSLSQPNLLLIPANTNIGVLQHNNNFYAFSTKDAAHAFMKNIGQFVRLSKGLSKNYWFLKVPSVSKGVQRKSSRLRKKVQNSYSSWKCTTSSQH